MSRIEAEAAAQGTKLSIDIATDIYPMANRPQFFLQLASKLHRGSTDAVATDTAGQSGMNGVDGARKEHEAWRIDIPGNEGISADFDYVMHGKVCFPPASVEQPEGILIVPSSADLQIRRRAIRRSDSIWVLRGAADGAHRLVPAPQRDHCRTIRLLAHSIAG